MKPRLWVVSELYYPEQTSTGYFLTRIAEGLAGDFEVHVLCGQPTYSEHGARAPRRERRGGADIVRLRATHFSKDRIALRALNLVTLSISAFCHGLFHFRRGDRVLAVTNPPSMPVAVGLAARLRGCRTILLVHDVYPEVLAAAGGLKRESLAYRALARLFGRTFRAFDRVVVLGRDMREIVAQKLRGGDDKLAVIPNWGDSDEISPIIRATNPFRAAHGLQDKFVVQFSGNIGRTHDVELVLEAAALLRSRDDIVFLFVGYGGKSGLIAQAGQAGLRNVRFLPRQPREALGAMLAASDATVIPLIEGMYGLSVPSRMYNVMAAGVPIVAVAEPRSELALTVAEEGAGWVLGEHKAEALAELIASLAAPAGRADGARRGAAGRAAVLARYSLASVLERYRLILA